MHLCILNSNCRPLQQLRRSKEKKTHGWSMIQNFTITQPKFKIRIVLVQKFAKTGLKIPIQILQLH